MSEASAGALAGVLAQHVDAQLARTTAVRDALYGSLLAALQLHLAEVGHCMHYVTHCMHYVTHCVHLHYVSCLRG